MQRFFINGGNKLYGSVTVDTAKNAILPILAATILVDGKTTLLNATPYSDVLVMSEILSSLGAETHYEGKNLVIDSTSILSGEILLEQASKLRASIFALGPLLARVKKVKVAYPGGCAIGLRPIDISIYVLKTLGAKIVEKNGYIYGDGTNMHGAELTLSFASVGATENAIMAATTIKGRTIIHNAAKEPEIVDLADFLNGCGAKISGAGTSEITIDGVEHLCADITYQPISDRIVAGTYMIACAICGGEIMLQNARAEHNKALISKLSQSACQFDIKNDKIVVSSTGQPKGLGHIETAVYPGLPTDLQPQLMTLASVSEGASIIVENLFESRFKHAAELIRMGADIKVKGQLAMINGKNKLYGAEVKAQDLRGGAALVLAGLKAEGYTSVAGVEYIDRGYYKFEEKLCALGADITREEI